MVGLDITLEREAEIAVGFIVDEVVEGVFEIEAGGEVVEIAIGFRGLDEVEDGRRGAGVDIDVCGAEVEVGIVEGGLVIGTVGGIGTGEGVRLRSMGVESSYLCNPID